MFQGFVFKSRITGWAWAVCLPEQLHPRAFLHTPHCSVLWLRCAVRRGYVFRTLRVSLPISWWEKCPHVAWTCRFFPSYGEFSRLAVIRSQKTTKRSDVFFLLNIMTLLLFIFDHLCLWSEIILFYNSIEYLLFQYCSIIVFKESSIRNKVLFYFDARTLDVL